MMTSVEETCSCGATFKGSFDTGYQAQGALDSWRKDHKHNERMNHPANKAADSGAVRLVETYHGDYEGNPDSLEWGGSGD